MLHPVYEWMSWVQILNPIESAFSELFPLIAEAHSSAASKFNKKAANNAVNLTTLRYASVGKL